MHSQVGEAGTTSGSGGDRFVQNLKMYKASQSTDRELYRLVNERATIMMNVNQKWYDSFIRFFQNMPVGLRWLCHQFEFHLSKRYSDGSSNSSHTTVAVLDFVLNEMVLPILHNSPLWAEVAVKERWGVTIGK